MTAGVSFNDSIQHSKESTFVQDVETLSGSDSRSILTPFLLNGTSSQSIDIELSDLSTLLGGTYSPGDDFILDGKNCKAAEWN